MARLGYRTIINNRPDGEDATQLPARQAAAQARLAGLSYRHVPAAKLELFEDRVVGGMTAALSDADGPVLAHCKSGQRAAILWAAAQARGGAEIDELLATLAQAGFDLDVVRDELEAVAADGKMGTVPFSGPALAGAVPS